MVIVKLMEKCLTSPSPLLQGEIQSMFLRHEGYLGAIGAFLKGAEEDGMYTVISNSQNSLLLFSRCNPFRGV